MSRKAANIISAQVIMKPDCVLGLATGGTPVGTYEKLVERYNEGDLDFSEVTSVNLDEYRGLPKDHPESYWSFMHRNLFDHVNIDPAHINLPDGTNMDAEAECKRYDEVIRSVGGVDLQLLGIGVIGALLHIDGVNQVCHVLCGQCVSVCAGSFAAGGRAGSNRGSSAGCSPAAAGQYTGAQSQSGQSGRRFANVAFFHLVFLS